MRQLQGLDASFVALETRDSPMHIGSILIFNPDTAPGRFVRYKDVLRHFEERLQLSKIVRRRLVRVPFDLDYPYWIEDKDFDLEYHIRHVALPQPGDWRQLCILAARIFARPLDLSRPPWEFTIVEGLDNIEEFPKGCFAILTKVHHAAIDGASGIDLMQALFTGAPDTPSPVARDEWQGEPSPGPASLLGRSLVNGIFHPYRHLGTFGRTMPGLARLASGLIARDFSLPSGIVPPRTRFNNAVSPHRVVEGRRYTLKDVKEAARLVAGAKVNDVFIAGVGGALRRYLVAKNELPDKTMTAMVPISVREDGDSESAGNDVAAMIVPLGTHIDNDRERLRFVHEQTMNSKLMTAAIGARNLCDVSKANPALFSALGAQIYGRLGLANRLKPLFNTVVTNVPGPPVSLYTAGAQLESMMGLTCLTDSMGLGHVVQSYVKEATVCFTADRNMMPDPAFYGECLNDSFRSLFSAAKASNTADQKIDSKRASSAMAVRKSRKKSTDSTLDDQTPG